MDINVNLGSITKKSVIVGIDIAKENHYAKIIDNKGQALKKPFQVKNNRESFERLVAVILSLVHDGNLSSVIVGLESTGSYWKALRGFLVSCGIQVVQVNPHHVNLSKESYDNSQTKSDPKDAGIIAELVRNGRFTDTDEMDPVYEDLRELATTKLYHCKTANGHICNIRSVLDEHFPEFFKVLKDVEGKGALWVLTNCPFPDDIVAMGVEKLYEGISSASRGKLGMTTAMNLLMLAETSIGTKRGNRGFRSRLASHLAGLQAVREQLSILEEEMISLLKETGLGDLLTSLPGTKEASAAMFLSEVGDPRNYIDWRQVRRLGGLNLVHQSSGKKKGKTTISKRGRPLLRRTLYFMALGALRSDNAFNEYYLRLTQRQVNPLSKKAALIALGSKILRTIFALIEKQSLYNDSKARLYA